MFILKSILGWPPEPPCCWKPPPAKPCVLHTERDSSVYVFGRFADQESRQDITVVAVRRILQLIQKLGLLVNVLKSNLNPSQVLYLKPVLNTRMSVFPSDERYK